MQFEWCPRHDCVGSWWCVGVTTLSLSALVEGQHCLHSHRVLTISAPCTPSPFWLKCRCFQLPPRPTLERHLGGLACVSRTSPHGVGRGAPPRFVDCPGAKCAWHPWVAQGPVSLTMVSRVCSVTMVALVACTPSGTGGYPACYQCGVASAQCGGIGSPGAVVPLCQVTLLASSPLVAPRLPW